MHKNCDNSLNILSKKTGMAIGFYGWNASGIRSNEAPGRAEECTPATCGADLTRASQGMGTREGAEWLTSPHMSSQMLSVFLYA
jgi:hypothetical protein